jgi:hypothetical protein
MNILCGAIFLDEDVSTEAFGLHGEFTKWWTASDRGFFKEVWTWGLYYENCGLNLYEYFKMAGCPVRCVKD